MAVSERPDAAQEADDVPKRVIEKEDSVRPDTADFDVTFALPFADDSQPSSSDSHGDASYPFTQKSTASE